MPDAQSDPLRVLIVDDNRDQADSECAVLQLFGYRCATAYTVEAALEHLKSLYPDVVLLDMGMPRDSLRVAQRAREDCDKPPVVIAVTGHHEQEVRARAADAGVAMYLLKPVDMESLQLILDGIHARRRAARETA